MVKMSQQTFEKFENSWPFLSGLQKKNQRILDGSTGLEFFVSLCFHQVSGIPVLIVLAQSAKWSLAQADAVNGDCPRKLIVLELFQWDLPKSVSH